MAFNSIASTSIPSDRCPNPIGISMRRKASLTINPRNRRRIAQNSEAPMLLFQQFMTRKTSIAVARWYGMHPDYGVERSGGRWFFDWVKKNYRRANGEEMLWAEPFLKPYYMAFGNPWIERLIIEKPAQTGFTESAISLTLFTTGILGIPSAYGFEMYKKQRLMVPRFQATVDHCQPIRNLKGVRFETTRRKDVDSVEKMAIAGIECTFFPGRMEVDPKSNERQAPPSLSSFTAEIIIADEIELFSEGVIGEGGVAESRMEASRLPTKPFRGGSTPGGEGGIVDREVRSSGYLFQWQIQCPHCDRKQFIDPFGNLLKSVMVVDDMSGIEEPRYLDLAGKPYDWFCHDDSSVESRIKTAYIGCIHCGGELSKPVIQQGAYYCRNHDDCELISLCDRTVREKRPVKGIAIRFPKLAQTRFDASERISKLLNSRNPVDQVQQGLGKVASIGTGKINRTKLEQCIGRSRPSWCLGLKPIKVLCVDQGAAFHWGLLQHWYIPPMRDEWQGLEPDKLHDAQWQAAFKEVVWYGDLIKFKGIAEFADRHEVDMIAMDNEPEKERATEFCMTNIPSPHAPKKGRIYLCDQVHLKGENFIWKTLKVQGMEVPIIRVHRTWGLDCVQRRIYSALQSFPASISYAADSTNLLYHYLTSERTRDALWKEIPGEPDHWLHCDNFGEVAMLAQHYQDPGKNPFSFAMVDAL